MSKSCTLAKKKRVRAGAWRGKSGLHTEEKRVPRRRGREAKNLPGRSRRKFERVKKRKSREENLESVGFTQVWPNLPCERRLGDEGFAHKKILQNES